MSHLYCDRRKVLLVDPNPFKLKLRATMLRNREIEVHTAGSIVHAESLWRTSFYDLILLAAVEESEELQSLSAQIRHARPQQRIAWLVGPPTYVHEVARPARKKMRSAIAIATPQAAAAGPLGLPIDPGTSSPQWQQMMQKVVADWYSAKIQSW